MEKKTLRQVRLEKGWTIRDLIAASGVTSRTIVRLERGEGMARMVTRRSLSASLNVTPKDISWGDVFDSAPVSQDGLEKRLQWLELAVRECGQNIREVMKHVMELELRFGETVEVTIDGQLGDKSVVISPAEVSK